MQAELGSAALAFLEAVARRAACGLPRAADVLPPPQPRSQPEAELKREPEGARPGGA